MVDESCPGLLPQQLVADDFVADWRAVAVVVDHPEARPAPASPTDGRATRTATYPNDPVSEPPAARVAADTTAPPVPSQNAQAGQVPSDADAPSRCPNTIDHLRSADLARETDPAVSASARPGKTQQAFTPSAHTGKPALPVKDRAGDPEAPAQDVLDLDVDDIAPALRTVEPGWDPFPEPGTQTGDVSASGISFTVPAYEDRVRQDRGNDRGTLLEALLLMEAEALQERTQAMVHALPFAIDQRAGVSIERTGAIIDFGPVHARPAIFGRAWTIHGQHGEVLTTADDVEDIAKALIDTYFEELTDSASKTAPLTTEG